MRVLVCGGRAFADWNLLCKTLAPLKISVIIHGGALGADTLAGRFAALARIPVCVFHPEWDMFGRNAGPMRNLQMLREGEPDLVIAFQGGRGTANMVRLARSANIKVNVIK